MLYRYGELNFRDFEAADVELLTPLMRSAFDEDSMMHLGKTGGPDGYDNGKFLQKYALSPASTAYVILKGETPIGGLILWITKNNENVLGCLFITAEEENKGYGRTVWSFVEESFPETAVWRTETPIFSHRNHHFYINKCGFHLVRIDNPKDLEEGSYRLEKRMK